MATWLELLQKYPRIAIAGAPRTGKTTLSQRGDGRPVIGTDKYKPLPWGDVPLAMIRDVAGFHAYTVEGVQVARALRKGLPADAVVYLRNPVVEQSAGQESMGKGIRTVMLDWLAKTPAPPDLFERVGDNFIPLHPRAL